MYKLKPIKAVPTYYISRYFILKISELSKINLDIGCGNKYALVFILLAFICSESNVINENWKYMYDDNVFSAKIEMPSDGILNDVITVKIHNNTSFEWKIWGGNWGCASVLFVWTSESLANTYIAKYDTIRPLGFNCIGWEFEEHNPEVRTITGYSEITINKYLIEDSWSIGNLFINDAFFDKINMRAIFKNGPLTNSVGFDYMTYFLGMISNSFGQWTPYWNSHMWKGVVESNMILIKVNKIKNVEDKCFNNYNKTIECRVVHPVGFVSYGDNELIKSLIVNPKLIFRNSRDIETGLNNTGFDNKLNKILKTLKNKR